MSEGVTNIEFGKRSFVAALCQWDLKQQSNLPNEFKQPLHDEMLFVMFIAWITATDC